MNSIFCIFLFLPCLLAMQMVHAPGTYPVEETKQDIPTVPKNPYQSMGGGVMEDNDEPYKILFYYEKDPPKSPAPSAPSPAPSPISPESDELATVHRPATPTFSESSLFPGPREFPVLHTDPDDPRYVNVKPKPQRIQLWDDAQKNNQPIRPEIEVVPSVGSTNEKPDSQPDLYYEKESGYDGPTPPTLDPYKNIDSSEIPGAKTTETGSGAAERGSGAKTTETGSGAAERGSGANGPNGKAGGGSRKGAPGATPDGGSTAEFPDPESLTKSLGKASSWENYSSQEKDSSGNVAGKDSSSNIAATSKGSLKMKISKGNHGSASDISGEDGGESIFSKSTHNAPGPFDPQIAVSASKGKNTRFESNESFPSRNSNNGGSWSSGDAGKLVSGTSSLGRTSSSSSFAPEHMHRIDSDIDFEDGSTFTSPSSHSSQSGRTSSGGSGHGFAGDSSHSSQSGRTSSGGSGHGFAGDSSHSSQSGRTSSGGSGHGFAGDSSHSSQSGRTSSGGSGRGFTGDSSHNQGAGEDAVLGQVTFPPETNPSKVYDSRLQPSSNKNNCCACCKDDENGKTYNPYEKNYDKESRGDFGKPYPIIREGGGYKETVHVAEERVRERPNEPSQSGVPVPQNYYQPKSAAQYRERPQGVQTYPIPNYQQPSQIQTLPAAISDADVLGTAPEVGSSFKTQLLNPGTVGGTSGQGFNPVPIGTGNAVATQVAPASYAVGPQLDHSSGALGSYGAPAQAYAQPGGSCGCAQQQIIVQQQTCCQPVQPCCMPTIPCCPPPPPIPCCPPISLCCQPQPCCPPPPTCCQQPVVPQCYRACPSCPCRRRMHASLRMKRSPGTNGSCSACSASGQHMPGRRKRQTGCKSCSQSANPFMGLFNHGGSCGTCNQSHKRTKRFGCLPCLGGRKKRSAEEEEEHKRVKRFGCLPCLGGRKKRSAAQSNCHSCSNLGHILARAKRTICSPCGRKKREAEEAVRRAPCPCAQNRSIAPSPAQSHLVNPLLTRGKRAIDPGYDSIFTCDQSCCDYSKCNKLHAKRLHRKIQMN